ncbi:pancreatic triacylglycerol lipase-like [Anopheles moucheti]|uniref:pancreatic triacylglycerol lipase-like n=1 Tax=Anopheles moucheti TaxID=186751 RepID=UPI0022F0A4C7|nr:pancreatic triacylglycerol lipase-like [Anopheles moucheti]
MGYLIHTMLLIGNFTNENDEGCFGMFGCYPVNSPWTSERRPIALLPQHPEELGVRFVFFNTRNRGIPQHLNKYSYYLDIPEIIKEANINKDEMVYFISHGFLEKGATKWIEKMMNRLLDKDPGSTVIVIDWGQGSNPPYNQAVANIRLVGNIAAHFIKTMKDQLQMDNLDNVHMIGHSLGAHLSGYAGSTLKNNPNLNLTIGRITGLDPAELAFTETDVMVRLDPSDAKFVDIVHSDATPFVPNIGLGLFEPIGHVDFYPNGGFNQPGCERPFFKQNNRFVSDMFHFFSCSHSRAYEYFTESIINPMKVVSCGSYDSYNAGECFDCGADGAHCLDFGMNSIGGYSKLVSQGKINPDSDMPVQLYFKTDTKAPYLKRNVKFTIKISGTKESVEHGAEIGKIFLYFDGDDSTEPKRIYFNEAPVLFEPGFSYSSVIAVHSNSKPIKVKMGWEYVTNLFNPLTWRLLSAPRVYVDHVDIQFLTHHTPLKLCQAHNVPISTNEVSILSLEKCTKQQSTEQSDWIKP